MTTGPGGPGDGENAIDIPIVVRPSGDAGQIAREMGEEVVASLADAVGSHPIELPRLDPANLIASVDDIAGQIETRLTRAADELGIRLNEAMRPQPLVATDEPFRNQTEALRAYRAEIDRLDQQLQRVLGNGVLTHSTPAGTSLETALGQYQRNLNRGVLDDPSKFYLTEEARGLIESGQVGPIPQRADYLGSTQAALKRTTVPGDSDEAAARAQAELQRVLLDNVTYSLRDGTWLRMNAAGRSMGAVEDPAVLTALRQHAQTVVDQSIQDQINTAGRRNPDYDRYGLTPSATYGAGLPSRDVLDVITEHPQTTQGLSDLVQNLQALDVASGSLNRTLDILRGNIERAAVEEQAWAENTERTGRAEAQAAAEAAAYEARLRALTQTFNDADQQRNLANDRAGQALIAEAQRRAEATYGQNVAYSSYGGNIAAAATMEATQRETELAQAMIRRAQDAAYETYGVGGGGGGRPPTAVGAPSPDDDWIRQFMVAMQRLTGATDGAEAALARLERMTVEEMQALIASRKIPTPVMAASEQAGLPGIARSGNSYLGFDPTSGKGVDTISETEALAKAQELLGASARGAADDEAVLGTSVAGAGRASQLSKQEMREQAELARANQGIFQRYWQAAFGGDVADLGHTNAAKRTLGDNAEFLGAITRYQVAYAGIFAISRGMSALVNDTTESQTAVIHLAEALQTGQDQATSFAISLNDVATAAGTSVVGAMEAATRGIFAFGDQAHTPAQREEIGRTSAQAAAMGSVLAGGDPNKVQTDLIGTVRDFNGTAQDQVRVLDAATNAYRNYGAAIGDILQSLPIVGEQARQAGLSVEQTANYISLIESHTGQTGTAAGTSLARILEATQKPAFSQALSDVGVDTTQNQASQIQQLADRWNTLTQAQQDNFAQVAVGSRGAASFLAIMTQGQGIIDANARSYAEAGAAQQLFYQQQNTLGQTIRRLGSDLQAIGLDLARSGILDIFGVAAQTLDPFLHGLDDILRIFDAIPGSIRPWVTGLLEVYGVLLLIGKQMAGNAAMQVVAAAEVNTATTTVARGGLLGMLGRTREATIPIATDLRNQAGINAAEAETGTAASGLRGVGGALMGSLGVVAGLVALGAAVGGTIDAMHRMSAASDESAKLQKQISTVRSASEYRDAANALANAAVSERHASSGLFGSTLNALEGNPTGRQARSDDASGKFLNSLADGVDALAREAPKVQGDITTSLKAMQAAGYPAAQQVAAVADALDRLHISATSAAQLPVIASPTANGQATTSLVGSLRDQFWKSGKLDGKSLTNDLQQGFLDQSGGMQGISDVIAQAQSQLGIQPGEVIPPELLRQIGPIVAQLLEKRWKHKGVQAIAPEFVAAVSDGITQFFTDQSAVKDPGTLNDADLHTQYDLLSKQIQANTSGNPLRPDSQLQNVRNNIRALRPYLTAAQNQGDEGLIAQITAVLNGLEDDLVKGQVARAERLRAAAVIAAGGNVAAVLRANVDAVRKELTYAARADDITEIIAIIGTADKATMDIVNHSIDAELKIAQQSYDHAMAVYNAAKEAWDRQGKELREANPELGPGLPPVVPPKLNDLHHLHADIKAATDAGAPTSTANAKDTPDPDAIAVARIQASQVPGSALSAANVALQVAQYQKAHAKNQADYWNAVKAINDAEYQIMQAVVQYHHAQHLETIDITDPVAMAKEDLRMAKETLNRDRARGAGKDTIATDVDNTRQSSAREQAAVFDQRMHDAQVAHDLGQMSDAAYLRFLDGQRDRLQAIKHKSRQQIEELQQVDEAIKSAANTLSGQFNIGNIRLPTPYEVRRYIQAQGSASTSVAYAHSTSTVSVTINDQTSDQTVRRIVYDAIGTGAGRITTQPPKVKR